MIINYKLHKIPEGFIVTSDESIKKDDEFIIESTIGTEFFTVLTANKADAKNTIKSRFKVIARQEQIDFSALSEKEQKKIGWIDAEKFCHQWFLSAQFQFLHIVDMKSFIAGFQKAQELLSDKQFTKQDVLTIVKNVLYDGLNCNDLSKANLIINNYLIKSWDIKIQTENNKPKLTDGKVKILRLL